MRVFSYTRSGDDDFYFAVGGEGWGAVGGINVGRVDTVTELPNNTCLYEYEWMASIEGGERKRTDNEKTADLKKVTIN